MQLALSAANPNADAGAPRRLARWIGRATTCGRSLRRWLRGRPGRTGQRGVASVELVLFLPVLLVLMINVWDFGRVFYLHLNLTDAAYQGARLAAHRDRSDAAIRAAVKASAPALSLADNAIAISRPGTAGLPATVSVVYPFEPYPATLSRWVFGKTISRQASEIVR